ncbi:hypothetical protein BOQ62_05785 [Chryseobacterium sp. CH21]|uniref:hypothetical protein n=1 Tax=Chryseobacterium sp. CH21 TaxID=713556 RepID=UPI00100B6380|nr:hypothetical protein [Chryseobacterium sp. CH21]RXM40471.1 hypothetical protein BOQ62_05785 [Chryseobacterium sp. CH21]
MERNYFLSYGHKITLILLLAAVGKLNAKFISVTMTNPELSYYTDTDNPLQRCLADVSIHLFTKAGNNDLVAVNKEPADKNQAFLFYYIGFQYNTQFFKKNNIQISFPENIKFVAIRNEKNYLFLNCKENTFLVFDEVKNFYTNSIKLVDGFKFIIKIPDKLVHSLIS